MQISFVVDFDHPYIWQEEAVRRLMIAGRGGRLVAGCAPRPSPAVRLVAVLESRLYRLATDRPLAPASLANLGLDRGETAAGLVIDLTGTAGVDGLSLACGGRPLDAGAVAAVVAGVPPELELVVTTAGRRRVAGRWPIGVEDAGVIGRAVAGVYGRAVDMLALAVDLLQSGVRLEALVLPSAGTDDSPAAGSPLGHFAGSFVRRLARRLPLAGAEPPRWMTAWRRDAGRDGALPDLGGPAFSVLADDGRRFYADPFLARRDGRTVLFVEDYPFDTGRGVISAVEMGPDGPAGRPAPVLETDCHLSYPYLFETGGDLFMLPETSGRRSVELWRCEGFPDRWRFVETLIDGLDVSDATVFETDGRWFLFGAERPRWCSSWDGLSLWTAERLAGPWRRVGAGPVKVDVGSARPAGRPIEVGGATVRPFQDSVGGYGAGLGFARIDRLDGGGFAETILHRIRPTGSLRGVHTYERGFGFEVIDVFAAGEPATVDFSERAP